MKELLGAIYFSMLIALVSGCTAGPKKVTERFLTDLRNEKYADAQNLAAPSVKKQIAIIEQDKHAFYNGQKWNYRDITAQVTNKTALLLYTVKLNDGTEIKQRARLAKLNNRWLINSIENIKIIYSSKALTERTYPDYGTEMLTAPLDIEYITAAKVAKHAGKFVMVSGNLCGFEEKNNTIVMTMCEDDSKPLLSVTVTGSARALALKEHQEYMHIDSMVKSAMGDTFTGIGMLNRTKERFSMDVSNPQNITIGRVLRVEKR